MRVVGIDPGRVRVGVAISDDAAGTIALPLESVAAGKSLAEASRAVKRALEATLSLDEIARVVVGLPIGMNGREGSAARKARALGEALGESLGRPIEFWDERLTTTQAHRALSSLGLKERERRTIVDRNAAAIILQSYLDAQAYQRT